MRVAVDVTPLVSGNTGVARYARMLLDGLRARDDVDATAFAVGRGPSVEPSIRRVRVPLRIVQRGYRHVGWPRAETIVGPADIVHAIDIVPPATRAPLAITIHDVLPILLPEQYASRQRMMIEAQLRAAPSAQLVVTTCEATAAEIVRHTDVRPEQLLVAPLGHREVSAVEPPCPYDEAYVLAVGALTPRKGFHHLVAAIQALGDDAPLLVLVGPDGWQSEVIHASAASLPPSRVRIEGYATDERLEALYRHAAVVCHPSEAEGFGIPVLEAMAFGAPVVAADIPPVREIGAGAVLLVPPRDPTALSEAIDSVLRDPDRRRRMSELGRQQARPLTWERFTSRVVEGYRRVVE